MIHRGSPPFLETPVTGDQSQPVIVMFGRTNIQLDQLWLWVPFGWRKQPISSAIWFFLHCQYCQLADHIGQEWLYPLRWHKLNILNQHCSILPMWSRIIDNMGSTTSLDLIIPIISCSMKKNGIPQYRKKLIPSSISDILSEDYSHMIYYAIPILFLYIYISDIYHIYILSNIFPLFPTIHLCLFFRIIPTNETSAMTLQNSGSGSWIMNSPMTEWWEKYIYI